VPDSKAPESDTNANETSPRLDLSKAALRSAIKPPPKPFQARAPKGRLFRTTQIAREMLMSDRFSADRMAAFNPQIPRRVSDIPNPAAVRAAEADADGKRLVVGKQVRIKGEISGCERLIVEGQVDAQVADVKTLEVSANGSFKGSADVETATISGTYDGTLKVSGHLDIAASGVVSGTISYKSIAVANGGRLQGAIEATS